MVDNAQTPIETGKSNIPANRHISISPDTKKKFMLLGLMVGLLLICIGVYYFMSQGDIESKNTKIDVAKVKPTISKIKINPKVERISYDAANVDTSNWKEYMSSDSTYSFKYPSELVYIYVPGSDKNLNNNWPLFFKNSTDAKLALNCRLKEQGTLENPCKNQLFDVTNTTKHSKEYQTDLEEYLYSNDQAELNSVYLYIDRQERTWIVQKPIFGLVSSGSRAQTLDGNKYGIHIQIYENFISVYEEGGLEKQIEFVNSIIDSLDYYY